MLAIVRFGICKTYKKTNIAENNKAKRKIHTTIWDNNCENSDDYPQVVVI